MTGGGASEYMAVKECWTPRWAGPDILGVSNVSSLAVDSVRFFRDLGGAEVEAPATVF